MSTTIDNFSDESGFAVQPQEGEPVAPALETATPEEIQTMEARGIDPAKHGKPRPYQPPAMETTGLTTGIAPDSILATGDPGLIREAEENGVDPAKHQPPIRRVGKADFVLPGGVSRDYTPGQYDYAIGQAPNVASQMDMFTYVNNIKGMIRSAERMGLPEQAEVERIKEDIGIPDEMVKSIMRSGKDEVEAYRIAAGIVKTAGPESYTYRMFANDPEFAADWRNYSMVLSQVESAMTSAFAPTRNVVAGWFTGTVASTANNLAVGIPAFLSQSSREVSVAEREKMLQDPIAWVRSMDPTLGLDDITQDQAREMYLAQESVSLLSPERRDKFDEWMQDTYQSTTAATTTTPATTGSEVLDSGVRPVVQGLGSYLPSMALGIIGGNTNLPAWLFGLSEGGDVYRSLDGSGMAPTSKLLTGLIVTYISQWAERFSLDTALDSPGLQTMWRQVQGNSNTLTASLLRLGGGMVRSGGSEVLAEVTQTTSSLLAPSIAKSITLGDPVKNIWDALVDGMGEIIESGWGGFGAGALGGGLIGGAGREMMNMWKYGRFQKSVSTVADAAAGMVKEKGAEAARTQVRNIIHDGLASGRTELQTTSFADNGDVKTFMQSMTAPEAEAFLGSIGTDRTAYERSVELGVDIEVPTEYVLTHENPEVRALFRPNPNMETATHLQNQYSETEGIYQQASKLQHTIVGDIERGETPQAVSTLYQDLRNAGKSATEAAADTSIYYSWLQTQAAKRGISVEELADQVPIRAAMDEWVKQNPAWMEGVRARPGAETATEESGAVSLEAAQTSDFQEGAPLPQMAPAEQQSSLDASAATLAQDIQPGTAAAVASQAPFDSAIQNIMLDRAIPTEETPVFAGYAENLRQAGNIDLAGNPEVMATIESQSREAYVESSALDKKAAELEALHGSGEALTPEEMNKLGLRAGDRDSLLAKAADLREQAGRWKAFYQHPDLLAEVQERTGTGPTVETYFQQERQARDIAAAGERIGELYDTMESGVKDNRQYVDILPVSAGLAQTVKNLTGLDIEGYIHTVDVSGIRHTLGGHGIEGEVRNDQAPIVKDDLQLIPLIVQAPDTVESSGKSRKGLELIRFGKEINNQYYLVEEIRTGRKKLALVTMYKKKGLASSRTSETYLPREQAQRATGPSVQGERSVTGNDSSTIPNETGNVKPGEAGPQTFEQSAYHGTPYRFNEFSTDAIGSGEGRQTEGWGLYFTADQQHADRYRESLSRSRNLNYTVDGQNIRDTDLASAAPVLDRFLRSEMSSGDDAYTLAGDKLREFIDTRVESMKANDARIAEIMGGMEQMFAPQAADIAGMIEAGADPLDAAESLFPDGGDGADMLVELSMMLLENSRYAPLRQLEGRSIEVAPATGQLYEASIPENDTLLHRDSPLAEQPEAVRDGLRRIGDQYDIRFTDTDSGADIYEELAAVAKAHHYYGFDTARGNEAASRLLNSNGIQGIAYQGNDVRGAGTTNFVVFDDGAIDAIRTYYQGQPQRIRGKVELYGATPQQRAATVIRIMKAGDRSTVPHELAHVFFADMQDLVMNGKADVATIRDYGKLLAWAGDLTQTENIEKVTRGFEQYLREGRAPSIELADSFSLFSRWLARVYSNIRQYVAQDLDDNVRGVYDRWLASDRQIREANTYYNGLHGDSFVNLLQDEEQRQKLAERRERNRRRIVERYAGDMIGALLDTEAMREQIIRDVEREVGNSPTYRAIEDASRLKLDRAGAEAIVGKQVVTDIIARHGSLFANAGGADADVGKILSRVGYHEANADTLFLTELAEAKPVAEAVGEQGSHGRRNPGIILG